MKGGFNYKMLGRPVSVTLTALVCTTILLLVWEKNPIADTLLLAREHFPIPSIDFLEDSSSKSLKTDENVQGKDSTSVIIEAKEIENSGAAPVQGKGSLSIIIEKTNKTQNSGAAPIQENSPSTTIEETNKIENSGAAPTDFVSSPGVHERNSNATSPYQPKVCNYAKGRWIPDSRRPLYSGFHCKQWLSAMWACRLTQRPDFSFEGYRWKPESCEMPEFERSAFLRRMQDKTIAFIGDSLGRQQFQSLMCMATGGEESPEVQNVGKEYGLVKRRGAIRPDGWAYRFPKTNTTILYYWSASLCDLVPLNSSNRTTDIAMHLDRPPAFMRQYLDRFDVLVLNTGHHWNRGKINGNRWVMYVDGKPNEDKRRAQIDRAKNFTIHSVVRWLDSQLPSHPHLKTFFRTISPRHFFNGDWNTGGSCDNTTPMSGGSEVVQEGSSDLIIESALRGTKTKILDITALSQLRDEGHVSRYTIRGTAAVNDCLHWCLPGIPDTWNEILIAQI
ncbi:putative PMR5 domain, PC-Esterase [Rosa chinensis]|uniref:Putative PMR5 domain, PC-Esterase n=1 Tax=Rosa chinensis TaxID=74649 RepID=A0A2P6RSN1_ROSCH|nr:protein trichome birefringence-like 14 [Rosa chinensis]XP_040370501.1 protein trichome birefringence-like 14 [Rosa chinensis]PRQ49439.1 putative PMR5 domain, PC-Esterase [Rosa chinensis]